MRATEEVADAATDVVAPTVAPRRLEWLTAIVRAVIEETARVRSLVLSVPGWGGHRAGQHLDVRLTGEDGYQAQRSYSIASAPEDGVTITVERIDEGEVSPYLAAEVRAGDQFEVRGPIGGYFVWTAALGGPLFLVAGGSGVVPLTAMLRHRANAKSAVPAVLLYSSRSDDDIIYRAELERLAAADNGLKVVHTLTRRQPSGWGGHARRIDRALLSETGFAPQARPRIFVCGPTPLVESVARDLHTLGHAPALIKTERFGPTGG
jgi:ferredoxin-NADP reductase